MATKIQTVTVPARGEGKYFTINALTFPMNATSISFYWQILTETFETVEGSETPVSKPGSSILDGNLIMKEDVIATWGNDDSVVIDWALSELGLTAE
jgi:hypothetical protein